MLINSKVSCIGGGKIKMSAKPPVKNDDLARKKALQTLLEETKTSVEDKIAALKTVHAVDRQKISAALSSMMKKD